MNARNIALSLACALLAACSGGGGTGTTPTASTPGTPGTSGSPTQNGSVAGPGKVGVSISFKIPAKSTQSKTTRSPQYIAANTTGISANFVSTTNSTDYSNSGSCSAPTCSLTVFVPGGDTYNVSIAATDGNGPLSIYTQNNFAVTVGAANSIGTAGSPVVFSPVLANVQMSPGWTQIYNGQVTSMPLTVNLLDVDDNPIPAAPAPVDIYGTPVTGLQVTPSGAVTPAGAQNITTNGQLFNFSYGGNTGLPNTLSFTVTASTGDPSGLFNPLSISVLSPLDVAQTSPAAFNGGNPGNPNVTIADTSGNAYIEYPLLASGAQQLTVTDNDTVANTPITIDPSNCTSFFQAGSFYVNGTNYVGSPITVGSYTGPFPITYDASAGGAGNCAISMTDGVGNLYTITLFYDQFQLYVTSKTRKTK